MSALLTIVMYHYVRPLAASAYPNIKGLEYASFEQQLDYLQLHYQFVTARQVLEAARGGRPLPGMPVLLTFDDGYVDHYAHVFPTLRNRAISGVFFPPSCTTIERKVLDVNKIHFILAAAPDPHALVRTIDQWVAEHRERLGLADQAQYHAQYHLPNRFDGAEVNYVKRMLQKGLPESLRQQITAELFRRIVTSDEGGFADELYLDVDDLAEMAAAGMEIGSHGHAHYWLDALDAASQRVDIVQSLRMLDRVGLSREDFLFCFPYGAYNGDTLEILREEGCGAAFSTHVDLAEPATSSLLALPRLDTNDLPREATAPPGYWTQRARISPISGLSEELS
jgi:peptidoglycan/xylan/chitin deacetylase (PgdA/CDA1 family)